MTSKEIKQLITPYDKQQLESLILSIATKNEAAQKILLEFCKKQENNPAAPNYHLIVETQLKQYWATAAQIIDEFDTYGGGPDHEMDLACDALKKVEDIVEENNIPWSLRKPILDEMLKFILSDNSGFSDYLTDITYSFCEAEDEKRYLAEIWERCGDSYHKQLAAKMFLELGEDEKYLEIRTKNLESAWDYVELAKYYRKRHDEERALKIVKEGLNQCDGNLDEIYQYLFQYYKKKKDEAALEQLYKKSTIKKYSQDTIARMMYEYYREMGNYEKKKAALLRLIKLPDVYGYRELYSECKKELNGEDFKKEEGGILNIIRNRDLRLYLDILLEKGKTDEVLECLMSHGSQWLDGGHYFTKRLKGKYPKEVLKLYWTEVSNHIGSARNYHEAVNVLKEIEQIMKGNGWLEEWDTQYKEFREKNKRKRNLMALLEKL